MKKDNSLGEQAIYRCHWGSNGGSLHGYALLSDGVNEKDAKEWACVIMEKSFYSSICDIEVVTDHIYH